MMGSLTELAEGDYAAGPGAKPVAYYRRYDEVFGRSGFRPTTMLEIGVHMGESTRLFAEHWPDTKIVAVDLRNHNLDFSAFPNVTYIQADQSDVVAMEAIIATHFPDGIDLVIDDASHIGYLSRATWDIVFPHVVPGGIYVVEDWGTGYWDNYYDGGRYQEYPLEMRDGNYPRRLSSHDFGMVGFVKSLVDYTGEQDMRLDGSAPVIHDNRLASLEFSPGICIAHKSGGSVRD